MTNIAKALIGTRRIPIRITGVRPGEKLHEIMVFEEEIRHCFKCGSYYDIIPMLPELAGKRGAPTSALKRGFSSADNLLSLAGTVKLLRQHRLMVKDGKLRENGELLR